MAANEIEVKEAEFHDSWASQEDIDDISFQKSFQAFTAPENSQIVRWIGDPKGLKILELGAGLGEASLYFASLGADVTATDISPGMLEVIRQRAQKAGVKVRLQVVSANELTGIEDNSFDIVYAANLLHHVNIEQCIQEAHRVLKANGSSYFWDPLQYNPVINIYRSIATKVRTTDEHPLRIKDIESIRRHFSEVEIKHFWLSAMVVFLKFFIIDHHDPNKVRYWKKILADYEDLKWLRFFHHIDQLLFTAIPPLKWWAWNITIRAKK